MATAKVAAEFSLSPFRAAILSIPPGKGAERFVYRMMFFEGGSRRPCFAVSMERTILGSWCVSSESAAGSVVHEHLAVAPSLEAFTEKALAIATPALEGLLAAPGIPGSLGGATRRKNP